MESVSHLMRTLLAWMRAVCEGVEVEMSGQRKKTICGAALNSRTARCTSSLATLLAPPLMLKFRGRLRGSPLQLTSADYNIINKPRLP